LIETLNTQYNCVIKNHMLTQEVGAGQEILKGSSFLT